MSFITGVCPQCNCELEITRYEVHCTKCPFTAQFGDKVKLSEKDIDALLLLGANGGKVITVYASLKDIPCTRATEIMEHPDFKRGEYQHLLNYYNALGDRCREVLKKKGSCSNLLAPE